MSEPRTPEQVLEYCKDADIGPVHRKEFIALALVDLPAMARRVMELEKELQDKRIFDIPAMQEQIETLQFRNKNQIEIVRECRAERDKLAAENKQLREKLYGLQPGYFLEGE